MIRPGRARKRRRVFDTISPSRPAQVRSASRTGKDRLALLAPTCTTVNSTILRRKAGEATNTQLDFVFVRERSGTYFASIASRDCSPALRSRRSLGGPGAGRAGAAILPIFLRAGRLAGRGRSALRVERSLAHTNDFQLPFSWGATLSALLGSVDDFDYLDRTSASAFVSRALGDNRRSLVRLEIGPARDNAVKQNISRGLYVEKGGGFRPNRGIREGSYFRTVGSLELNPEVSGLFVDRGVGARIHYERADGGMRWQRIELRTAARHEIGPFQLYARGDVGTVLGEPVPQVLFEIGGAEGLSAYGYKEFAGDHAMLSRAVLGYTFPFLRAPIHLPSELIVPGIAPGLAAGIHAAWTEVSNQKAAIALMELGTVVDSATGVPVPVSRATDGVRASAEFLITFFNGALAAGVTRPIDTHGPWKFTARMGQGF